MAKVKTFKIRFSRGREEEVRRLTLVEEGLTLNDLRKRASQLFKLEDNKPWIFKWQDEDGDLMSLTEEYELNDLMALKQNESLIRLNVHLEPVDLATAFPFMRCERPAAPATDNNGHRAPRFGARCDNTNASLQPGTGQWFHKPGTRVDLCLEEFTKLSDEVKAQFVLINMPDDLGEDLDAYRLRRCPYRGQCGRSRVQPQPGAPAEAFGWCDATNVALRVGEGWYHKIGTTYDLCESAFQKLSDEDKGAFVRVDSVEVLGDEIHRYVRFSNVDLTQLLSQCHRTEPKATETETEQVVKKQPKMMEIVSGPSVLPGTKVKAGSRLMPVWEVKNAAGTGIWTEIRLKPTSENPFKVNHNGFEVPMLEAGASGIVSVEIAIPEDIAAGAVTAEFVMVDSEGDVFGQPLVLNVEVVREQVVVDERVRLLQDMGFSDPTACAQALAAANDDITGAALALLRASK